MPSEVFRVLADERRRTILHLLQKSELSVGDIASHFDVTQPAISQHLKVLVAAQLVTVRRQGTRRLYRARPQGLAEVREFLAGFWEDSLLELKYSAENEERGIEPYGRN